MPMENMAWGLNYFDTYINGYDICLKHAVIKKC